MLNEKVIRDMLQPANAAPPDTLTVKDAIDQAILASNGRAMSKKAYHWQIHFFLDWLAIERPQIRLWSEVRAETIRAYVVFLRDRPVKGVARPNLARDSVRNYMVPVRMVARYWNENDPETYRNVGACAKLPPDKSNPLERAKRDQGKALSAADFGALLQWVKTNEPTVYGPMMLAGLCGLRVQEALALRRCDVDLDNATLTVTETETHTPKNTFSFRVIPIPPMIVAMLREAIHPPVERGAVIAISDPARPVFLNSRGEPWKGFSGYSHLVKRAVRGCWRDLGLESLRSYPVRYLRSSFASAVRSQGADVRCVQAYLGHSRSDILGTSYEQIGLDRMRAEILPAIEKWLRDRHNSRQDASETNLTSVLSEARQTLSI